MPEPVSADRPGVRARVRRAVRIVSTPGWLVLHALVLALAVGMVLLGRWQLDVSDTKHFDLQNFGYALQWWSFTTFALLLWVRAVRDTLRKHAAATSTGGELVRAARGGSGPAVLATRAEGDQAPVLYRGYVPPRSDTAPARSEGDAYHGSYNDYLWQLSLTDPPPDHSS